MGMQQRNFIYLILLFYLAAAGFCIGYFDGTGDSGDSLMHYLFAKYAVVHPELYFDHWAKPMFVLLASPFAQFGFVGMKAFNTLVVAITIFFTYRCAQQLALKNTLLITGILIFSPLYFILTFSGLTEPLFALFTATGLYAILKDKLITGAVIISFLPFVRSEGLIIIGVFAVYYLIKNQWKALPYFAVGHILYSIAGYFVYGDLLWVFRKIPYAHLSSIYGEGTLTHFVEQLYYVVGAPIYVLFCLGFLSIIYKSAKMKTSKELFILVFLSFCSFFLAHTLFWYLGIFNSMGLKRVLIAVMPLISIIALIGFNFLTDEILQTKKGIRAIINYAIVLLIIAFPFTQNHAAVHWEKDLSLTKDQVIANDIANFIRVEIKGKHRFIFAHPYLNEALKIDPFDKNVKLELQKDVFNKVQQGDIIIWDSWFSVLERDISSESLKENTRFSEIFRIENEGSSTFIVYQFETN